MTRAGQIFPPSCQRLPAIDADHVPARHSEPIRSATWAGACSP